MLDEIPPLPPTLHHLFTSVDDPLAKHFRKKIRLFNSGMAMASFQANDKTVTRGAPGCFKVVGQVYRRIGSLLANEQSNAKCLQVYFLDPDYQATLRATRYLSDVRAAPDEQDVEIFSRLRTSLVDEANNTYIASFLTVVEWIRHNRIDPEEVQIQLHETEKPGQGQHVGRFHLPTAPEVSVLLPSREQMSISKSSIVCSVRPQVGINGYDSLQIIRDHHRSIWPLLYPILFPHGTSGWHDGLHSNNPGHGRKVTLSEFCRWYMMIDSHLHYGRKLYQQFIVDNYTRIEANNLNWIRMNQKTIRAELYNNLQDAHSQDTHDRVGRAYILPASHTGSDRWYHKWYKNAMTLVQKYGKPTFFITMTMDPNCEEVRQHLNEGETPYDRPDIVCRIFELKRKELLRLIKEGHIFGECIAHVCVIEFQKRGAPHMHLLIWIKDFDHTPGNIDNVISGDTS